MFTAQQEGLCRTGTHNACLTETSHTLRGPGGIRLPVKGQFHATLKYGLTSITEPVYVLHNQKCSLLSRKACVELGLVMRASKDVEEVNSGPTDFKAEFPALFTALHFVLMLTRFAYTIQGKSLILC